jgi:hypothetical protein
MAGLAGKASNILLIIYGDSEASGSGKLQESMYLFFAHNLIGDEYVFGAGLAGERGGHYLGLTQFGAGYSLGAGGDLHLGYLGAFMGLYMGPKISGKRCEKIGHPLDIGLQEIQIKQQRRGIDFFQGNP